MGRCDFLNHSIIAHRGIYNNITIYENTLESIMYASKNNLIVEIDIRTTLDNEIIVYHDEDASRLNNLKDTLNTITLNDLEYISQFHIPTLNEVLTSINGHVPIIIEIKEDNKIIRTKLIELLKKYNGSVAIQSFNIDIVKFFKKKGFITGLLIGVKKNRKYIEQDLDVDFLNIKYNTISKVEANMLKQKYYLIGYTLDNRKEVETYIKTFNNLVIDNIEEVFK
mgnify:FL=1